MRALDVGREQSPTGGLGPGLCPANAVSRVTVESCIPGIKRWPLSLGWLLVLCLGATLFPRNKLIFFFPSAC